MRKTLLDPKIDFVFKNIFGSPRYPGILISFLNATLNLAKPIVSVEIKNTNSEDQSANDSEDKYSRLDVKALTGDNDIYNVDIQFKNDYNMIKRSMSYVSKVYEDAPQGEEYSNNNRRVSINILNFKYLKTQEYHTSYRLKEINTNEELTDLVEVHFIEIPKVDKAANENDMLACWLQFLNNPESEKVRALELKIDEIRDAKDELIRMSNNDEQRELYTLRSKMLRDKVNDLNEAEKKGVEKGMETGIKKGLLKGKIEDARNFIILGVDVETIAKGTGLSEERIRKLKQDLDR